MAENLKYNSKLFSMFGQNGSVFGIALPALHDQYNMKVLSSDMSAGAGLSKYKTSYPNDFINVGIAEQNLIGVSAGIAIEGFKTIAIAQACFISMRSFEQVRQYMGYMGAKCILVGINSGFALTYFGNTHYATEDIAILRTIPNLTILSPADSGEAVKAIEYALTIDKPVYIRLSGSTNNPVVYSEDFEYTPNKANVVKDYGNDVTILSTGSMVYNSMVAADQLKEQGIMTEVIDIHSVKPIDIEIIKAAASSKLLLTVEEHSIIGGLGGAVAEVVSGLSNMPRLVRLGVKDCFSSVGDYQYLLKQHGLTPECIVNSIIAELK